LKRPFQGKSTIRIKPAEYTGGFFHAHQVQLPANTLTASRIFGKNVKHSRRAHTLKFF